MRKRKKGQPHKGWKAAARKSRRRKPEFADHWPDQDGKSWKLSRR